MQPARAQTSEGSDWARVGGAALGAYSGSVLGVLGGLVPCNQTYAGHRCVRVTAIGGGAVGLAGGFYLGDADADRLADAAVAAGIGLGAGALVGLVAMAPAQGFGWSDVAALGLVGGAVGASGPGSAIGFGAGALTGFVLWKAVPSFEFADAVGLSLVGLAAGGLAGWVVRAADAQSTAEPAMQQLTPLVISLRF